MAKRYAVRNIRIPAELDDRMIDVVHTGGRYKSIAQFMHMAVHRLVTFEEGELDRKRQEEKLRGVQLEMFDDPNQKG
jgi:Arc/MetJ-type ribon-helix-helix transcriptional regulator